MTQTQLVDEALWLNSSSTAWSVRVFQPVAPRLRPEKDGLRRGGVFPAPVRRNARYSDAGVESQSDSFVLPEKERKFGNCRIHSLTTAQSRQVTLFR